MSFPLSKVGKQRGGIRKGSLFRSTGTVSVVSRTSFPFLSDLLKIVVADDEQQLGSQSRCEVSGRESVGTAAAAVLKR